MVIRLLEMSNSKVTIAKGSSYFRDNGYVVKRSVFSVNEIKTFRERVYEQYKVDKNLGLTFEAVTSHSYLRLANGCLLSKKNLYDILLDPRIIEFAREVLGSDRIVYWGDSSYQIGTGTRGFHRDCVDKHDFSRPDWLSPYSIIRIGIYLQDHSKHSGGLKVKPGSHEKAKRRSVFVNTMAGDLVVWNLKLLHSGNAVKLKLFSSLSIDHPTIENLVPSFLKKEQEQERISLFVTFASESPHLYRYISEYQLKRSDTIESLRASVWDQDALKLAEQRGLDVRVLLPEYQLKS